MNYTPRRIVQPASSGMLLILALLGSTTVGAHAYVDPGTGSYVFQMLIATLTGVVFLASHLKNGLLRLLGSRTKKEAVNVGASALTTREMAGPNPRA